MNIPLLPIIHLIYGYYMYTCYYLCVNPYIMLSTITIFFSPQISTHQNPMDHPYEIPIKLLSLSHKSIS